MTDDEIESHLKTRLEGWAYANQQLEKTYLTSQWKSTLMVVNAVGHLCELAWHHPELVVNYNSVLVRLSSHDIGAVTLRDIELAEQLDAFLLWQPDRDAAKSTGGLTGLPDDERFAYIRHESASEGTHESTA